MSRVRSPGYPALSLPDAVEMIRKVHAVQQSVAEPREVVIKHMGYSGVNGRSLKAISALIKYGFLEKVESGDLRVSQRAISILFPDPDNPESKAEALFKASREPQLFKEMFERWTSRPSIQSLESFLIKKEFNVNSIEQVARSFFETFDLVSGFSDSYDSNEETDTEEEGDVVMPEQQGVPVTRRQMPDQTPMQGSQPMNVTKPVFDFETVSINTVIDNQHDLEQLINRLQQIKSMLPESKQH